MDKLCTNFPDRSAKNIGKPKRLKQKLQKGEFAQLLKGLDCFNVVIVPMLHKTSGKIRGQARQASFDGEDFHKTMCANEMAQ